MGLFGSNYTKLESQLLEGFVNFLINSSPAMNQAAAKKTATDILDKCIRESKQDGSYSHPANLGDIILGTQRAPSRNVELFAEAIRKRLPSKQHDGVRLEDVRLWWNQNEIVRRMLNEKGNMLRVTTYLMHRKHGSTEDAAMKTRKEWPVYGDADTSTPGDDDAPLPEELGFRITRYIEKRTRIDPYSFNAEVYQYSSMNAFLRSHIRMNHL